MELTLPTLPSLPDIFPPIITGPRPDKIGDALVKDERMKLSEAIERYTGWRGEDARIGKAVILAESGGRANVDNGICCIGLLQLNYLVHRGKWGSPKDLEGFKEWAKKPANNLRAGYALWKDVGGAWTHPGVIGTWEVLANGSYKAHLNSTVDPELLIDKNSVQGAIANAAGDVVDAALGPLDELAGSLLSGDVWFRVAKFGGGAFLVIIGGAFLLNKMASTPAGQLATNVVPVGRAANAAKAGARSGAKNLATKVGRPTA